MTFGDFVRKKRLEASMSLRRFCELADLDPSNWSKIERGRLRLAFTRERLEQLAATLGLAKGSEEWQMFFDLATVAQREIPEELYNDEEVLAALPVFFRTLSGEKKPTKQELNHLIELLRRR